MKTTQRPNLKSSTIPVQAFILICFILLASPAHSQDLSNARSQSYLQFIYSISNSEARSLAEHGSKAIQGDLFHTLVDSFPLYETYPGKLPTGQYLLAHVEQRTVQFQLISVNTLFVEVNNNSRDLSISVFNKASKVPVTDANVRIGSKSVPFDPKTGTYTLFNTNKTGLLTVESGDELLLANLEKQSFYRYYNFWQRIGYSFPLKYVVVPIQKMIHRIKWGKNTYKRERPVGKGYIAFDKPLYKPGDTVKMKAFILSRRNKVFKKPVAVLLSEGYYDEPPARLTTMEPASNGGFLHDFVLGDTLQSDRNYLIQLVKPKNDKLLLNRRFRIEDYQLDETTYELRASQKNTYYRGDPLVLYASGQDANGLYIMDGTIRLVLSVRSIRDYYAPEVFVPDVVWEHTQALDPLGETKIVVPDSLLPAAAFSLSVEATFTNSNNEIHEERLYLVYDGQGASLHPRMIQGILSCTLVGMDSLEPQRGTYIGMKEYDTLYQRSIQYPFEEPINTSVDAHIFVFKDQERSYIPELYKDSVEIFGHRDKDSVYIVLENPLNLPIKYNIYKGKRKEFERGTCTQLDRSFFDPGNTSWFVTIQYYWTGDERTKDVSVHRYEKNLQISIDQPPEIDPGAQTEVRIEVTNYKEQPVEKVNLTALAINSQFEENRIPDLPYLGKRRSDRKKNIQRTLLPLASKFSVALDQETRRRWKLDTMLYYRFRYPENGLYRHFQPIESSNAQFFPHVFSKGFSMGIRSISIDGELAFIGSTSNRYSRYSIVADPGYHEVEIRMYHKKLRLDSVFFKKGCKLDLAIDIQHAPSSVRIKKAHRKLSKVELNQILENSLLLKNNFSRKPSYLWQKDAVYSFGRNTYADGFILGPLKEDTVHFAIRDHYQQSFLGQPGYEFTVTRDSIASDSIHSYSRSMFKTALTASVPIPGQVSLTEESIVLHTPELKWEKMITTHVPRSYKERGGDLRFRCNEDSTFLAIRLIPLKQPFTPYYYKGSIRRISRLKPGPYQLAMITGYNNVLVRDSIRIREGGTNFYDLEGSEFLSVDSLPLQDTSNTLSNWQNTFPAAYLHQNYVALGGQAAIQGVVRDKDTREAIPFANVILEKHGVLGAGGTTDFDGNYKISGVLPGIYDIKVTYVGYHTTLIEQVPLTNNTIRFFDIDLEVSAQHLEEVVITEYSIPLIDRDQTTSGGTVSAADIYQMPNRSASSIAASVGGVFAAGPIRGARANETLMYVDGVRVIGSLGEESETIPRSFTLRKNFRDNAYWKPDLITDESGTVSFEVRFPDNITKWDTYVLALDGRKHSGIGKTETRARKSLLAQLAVPRFLVEGDTTVVVGKSLNYKNAPEHIKTTFTLNDSVIASTDTTLQHTLLETTLLHAVGQDTLTLSYSLKKVNGYYDGEQRDIAVFPKGSEEAFGRFYILDQDTSMTFTPDSLLTNFELVAHHSTVDFMTDRIRLLKDYPHFCMEQCASKLLGFVAEKKICNQTGQPFHGDRQLQKMIRKLDQGQNQDGSWGWWPHSGNNTWMTAYILNALILAQNAGYPSRSASKALEYLNWKVDILKGQNLLYALEVLSRTAAPVNYSQYLGRFHFDSLTLHQKMIISRIRQNKAMTVELGYLEDTQKETLFGGLYWGNESGLAYGNSIDLSLQAYRLLESSDSLHPKLPGIRRYLINRLSSSRRINTYQTATALQVLLPTVQSAHPEHIQHLSMNIEGALNQSVVTFPYHYKADTLRGPLRIQKSGLMPVYLGCFSSQWVDRPLRVDSLFRISSWFESKGIMLEGNLTAGENTTLQVEVDVTKKAEYVMIEIPIPAGCSYGENISRNYFSESHREYRRNRTIIYCEILEPGIHRFSIRLEPRFSGHYTLNPVRVELMYFPTLFGRNATKEVVIQK